MNNTSNADQAPLQLPTLRELTLEELVQARELAKRLGDQDKRDRINREIERRI